MDEPTCSADRDRQLAERQTATMNLNSAALEGVAEQADEAAMAALNAIEGNDNT